MLKIIYRNVSIEYFKGMCEYFNAPFAIYSDMGVMDDTKVVAEIPVNKVVMCNRIGNMACVAVDLNDVIVHIPNIWNNYLAGQYFEELFFNDVFRAFFLQAKDKQRFLTPLEALEEIRAYLKPTNPNIDSKARADLFDFLNRVK